jgi:hypothetical protein
VGLLIIFLNRVDNVISSHKDSTWRMKGMLDGGV